MDSRLNRSAGRSALLYSCTLISSISSFISCTHFRRMLPIADPGLFYQSLFVFDEKLTFCFQVPHVKMIVPPAVQQSGGFFCSGRIAAKPFCKGQAKLHDAFRKHRRNLCLTQKRIKPFWRRVCYRYSLFIEQAPDLQLIFTVSVPAFGGFT